MVDQVEAVCSSDSCKLGYELSGLGMQTFVGVGVGVGAWGETLEVGGSVSGRAGPSSGSRTVDIMAAPPM